MVKEKYVAVGETYLAVEAEHADAGYGFGAWQENGTVVPELHAFAGGDREDGREHDVHYGL